MKELDYVIETARSYNNLDVSYIEAIASENIIYESQDVFSALEGKEEVFKYLKAKFLTVRNSAHPVFAEIGFLDNEPSAGIYGTSEVNHPCIILAQDTKKNKISLVLIKATDGKISRIDICTVFPHWSAAVSTGLYPS